MLLALDGLHPPSMGARVRFSGGKPHGDRRPVHRGQGGHRRLLDDPGEVEGRGDRVGVALSRRRTNEMIEVRQVFEMSDFPADVPRRRREARRVRAAQEVAGGCTRRARCSSPHARAKRESGLDVDRVARSSEARERTRTSTIVRRVTATATHRAIDAVWRIESARLIAGLARIVRDVGLAEELAQDALVAALEQWPESGVPDNPGAWLMATAKNRAIDVLRRGKRLERKHEELGHELEASRRRRAGPRGGDRRRRRRRPAAPRLHRVPSGPLRPRRASRSRCACSAV